MSSSVSRFGTSDWTRDVQGEGLLEDRPHRLVALDLEDERAPEPLVSARPGERGELRDGLVPDVHERDLAQPMPGAEQVLHRAPCDDLALAEDAHVIAEQLDVAEDVAREEDGASARGPLRR